ncbi:hypothetical protein SeMB42_g03284 [Synchytrium endobioticum]|uniref:Uncharacterized protein n=1 Tax=Synchytrium endobioticum TaxID=286115 RepID=A0A507D889_9FUNG|nr:hypothetical protein SeMB42_g03284 [Synchytrium endobioticum]TPX51108.1 hypothetical protein SeLEV6574_g00504 [Synchytrium endobioticum]
MWPYEQSVNVCAMKPIFSVTVVGMLLSYGCSICAESTEVIRQECRNDAVLPERRNDAVLPERPKHVGPSNANVMGSGFSRKVRLHKRQQVHALVLLGLFAVGAITVPWLVSLSFLIRDIWNFGMKIILAPVTFASTFLTSTTRTALTGIAVSMVTLLVMTVLIGHPGHRNRPRMDTSPLRSIQRHYVPESGGVPHEMVPSSLRDLKSIDYMHGPATNTVRSEYLASNDIRGRQGTINGPVGVSDTREPDSKSSLRRLIVHQY